MEGNSAPEQFELGMHLSQAIFRNPEVKAETAGTDGCGQCSHKALQAAQQGRATSEVRQGLLVIMAADRSPELPNRKARDQGPGTLGRRTRTECQPRPVGMEPSHESPALTLDRTQEMLTEMEMET